ncbi:sulfotransferase 1C2A-like [Lineus longissimus]|uniref:sulfotransferase 1C2A-like n=1 Tax=Lineus longissimus TaxID=88925 RepID=UPI002B4FA42E
MENASFDPLSYRIPEGHKYKGMVLEKRMYEWQMKKVESLEYAPDDMIVASYPKSGTTLTQEMVYLVRHDGDTDKAGNELITKRVPFLEALTADENCLAEKLSKMEHPRTFKVHSNVEVMENAVLSQKTRVVYVMRNPKDTLVSLFYFYRINKGLGNFPGTWNQFFDMAMADFDNMLFGNMLDHFSGWWSLRHLPNVLITRFEDLVRNPEQEIARIAEFCGKDGMSEETIDKITQATRFDTMKKNPKTNYQSSDAMDMSVGQFMRKGIIGDWKNHFTIAQNETFDRLIQEKLTGTGLEFCYE